MIFELQCADGVGDTLNGVLDRVGEIVHRIDAPLVSGIVMLRMGYTVDDRVSHVDVRGGHVDLSPEHLLAVRVLAFAHLFKELQVFFDAPVAIWGLFARLGQGPSVGPDLVGAEVADEGQPLLDQSHGALVHLIEIVRRPKPVLPLKAQPSYIFFDGVHILHVFLDRVGIVIPQITSAVVLLRCHEVQADGLGVTNMQVAVRLRRESRQNLVSVLAVFQILVNNIVDKICHLDHFSHFVTPCFLLLFLSSVLQKQEWNS